MQDPKKNKHGDRYEEDGETYMNDHINGADYHVPDRRRGYDEDEYPERKERGRRRDDEYDDY